MSGGNNKSFGFGLDSVGWMTPSGPVGQGRVLQRYRSQELLHHVFGGDAHGPPGCQPEIQQGRSTRWVSAVGFSWIHVDPKYGWYPTRAGKELEFLLYQIMLDPVRSP